MSAHIILRSIFSVKVDLKLSTKSGGKKCFYSTANFVRLYNVLKKPEFLSGQSVNQSISQSVNGSMSQSGYQSVRHLIKQPVTSFNEAINQPINQSELYS